ncbi:HAMP domain-containing histidine kinase, partial [Candidatus Woesearchaeota archaeon]|nr:HAMP domain-containing histidine kinase [Candidatus Woesearchaeota archaeon]
EQLFFIINLFSIKHKGGFILIECLDFLLKHNSLTKVIYFLRQIADLSIMTNIRFALLVDYTKLSDDVIYELKNYQNKFKKAQHHREDSSLIDFKGKFLKSNLEGNLVDVKDKDELFKRIKDTLRDIYDYSFVNIFLFDGNVLVNTNKHAKRRFIHLNSDNIFKKCVDDNREIVINSLNDDLYYKNKKIGDDLETVSTIYFGSDFIPTVIVPVGKEQLLGVVELSKNKKIKLDSEEYNEILYFIKNSFFLAEIFILKEHATKTSKRLKESDELKNNFISMISHELRTPLTSIRGYTSILKTNKNNNFNKNQEDILTIIEKETSNLTSIINDLLDVSKIESGKLDLFLDNENLKDIIKDAIKIMEGFAFEKGVSLEFEKVFKVIVNVDCSRIHQIFTNLLNNAIKFSYPGTSIKINMSLHKLTGKTIKSLQKKFDSDDNNFDVKLLNISNEEVKDFVCVEIGDTGIGIENKNISLLFDKFFQVSNHLTRSTTGTGLGLSIVKYLIELHNGFIDVESEINKGSQFKVYFPLIDEN